MQRLLPEAAALKSRLLAWTTCAAAGAALAALAGLLGRWCANPAAGWAAALIGAGAGAAAAARLPDSGEDAAPWAMAGGLAALCVPAILRFLGLALADARLLASPSGGPGFAAFVVGQAALAAAFAAAAWTHAARGAGKAGAAPALAAGAACAFSFRWIEPPALLAAAGLLALAAALWAEKPWARRESSPLRARAFLAAGLFGLALACAAPRLLRDVWKARLDAAYPGGRYLAFTDDGTRVWAAYRFSNGDGVLLRDGVLQSPRPYSMGLALVALFGQDAWPGSVLIAAPAEADEAFAVRAAGVSAAIEGGSRAENAAVDALAPDPAPARSGPADAALLSLRRASGGSETRRLAGPAALRALRAKLSPDAAVAILLPDAFPDDEAAAVAAGAAEAFGRARAARLPHGGIVVAAPREIVSDPDVLVGRLPLAARLADPGAGASVARGLDWRAASPSK